MADRNSEYLQKRYCLHRARLESGTAVTRLVPGQSYQFLAQLRVPIRLRLGVVDLVLDRLDRRVDVAIGDIDVGPAVEVVVEKEAGESEREEAGAAGRWSLRNVHEATVQLVLLERDHLVRKVDDDQAGVSGVVVAGAIDAHAGAGVSVYCHRRRTEPEFGIQNGGNTQGNFIFERPRDNLYTDRQSFWRPAYWNHGRRAGERIEPLRIPHGVEVFNQSPVDGPGALIVAECGNTGHGAQ